MSWRAPTLLALLCAAAGCKGEEDTSWVRFNADGDVLRVLVGPLPDTGGAEASVTADLLSNLGQTLVGSASVDPGAGPVGTIHRVVVTVFDDWELQVGRVSVAADAGQRGVVEIELEHDLADPGVWAIDLISEGGAEETRTDDLELHLWQAADPATATSTTTATSAP